jgi:hypothetical protein
MGLTAAHQPSGPWRLPGFQPGRHDGCASRCPANALLVAYMDNDSVPTASARQAPAATRDGGLAAAPRDYRPRPDPTASAAHAAPRPQNFDLAFRRAGDRFAVRPRK